ncbi:hypothetical protein AYI70_g9351 [Smittium culicis]|uniref:Endonuclease/exonuclease/phosphatase domain-containing protein n=1 Tax=Smittium culicis TaxID=133412 RepID=A0A1R1XBM9_9FUNG|nr:hypothetical protein AYI70_g9351 [Smittium culicis]
MDTPASKKFTLKLGTGFQHAKVTNSTGSRYNKSTVGRMIDHIYYAGFSSRPNWCTANRYLDLSDHMPIAAQWNLDALEVPAKKSKINAKKLQLAENNFVSHNRFTVLAETEMGLNELCAGLIDTVLDQTSRLECDNTILWSDITDSLRDTPNNKAPGADGVPSEKVYKILDVEFKTGKT